MTVWAEAALGYVQFKKMREGADVLSSACELLSATQLGDRAERVRVLAAAGIAHLTQAIRGGPMGGSGGGGGTSNSLSNDPKKDGGAGGSGNNDREDLRALAEDRFNQATRIDQFFPMTWVGKGMLNLSIGRIDQARFFFDTTLKHAGQVLPALLGMAAVKYAEKEFGESLELYGRAIMLYPQTCGASVRVGFGMCCYRLGQVDRAKAAFRRAHEIDPENVEAMAGIAILDLSTLDETSKHYLTKQENSIRLISMANLIDRSNAMIQNHLADHYFWKWSQVPGVTISVEKGSVLIKGTGVMNLDPGERVRIGMNFETHVAEEEMEEMGGREAFKVKDKWNNTSAEGLKLWRKDYDRVVDMAKGAYNSSEVPEIQAESLFLLARVYHVKGDIEEASKYYSKACKLAPSLTPARFGLAQTLIWSEAFEEAASNLQKVLDCSPMSTDAYAALGLLQTKSYGKHDKNEQKKMGLSHLKKAAELNPLDADLVLLQALALQQNESEYPAALSKYKSAVEMMERQGKSVPAEVFTNMGVILQETQKFEDALTMYAKALKGLTVEDEEHEDLDSLKAISIKNEHNLLFSTYADSKVKATKPPSSGSKKLVITKDTIEHVKDVLKVGDRIRLGDTFTSEIVDINMGDAVTIVHLKDNFILNSIKEEEEESNKPISILIEQTNSLLLSPTAISIAFNLARLHEDAGRTIAAIELHKAIIKRHPTYVNCYLRLACIARDAGSLEDCSEWLKGAVKVAPGNPEVLTVVGNLHLSLRDWAPAQSLFTELLASKNPKVEAYSQLSLGNIYFSNLNTPGKYAKHLTHSSDFYRRILQKDPSNFYAANGLGTILAERGDLFKAKEVFNRVREVSGDGIPDTLLNLGHIYLAQRKHPEALQMYQRYMTRMNTFNAAHGARSNEDEEILLYIAFAYFDWARQTESFNNAKAAPADERYQKCIEHIELAMKCSKEDNLVLRYNWCMVKLQAANCVLQKLTRNIPRTAREVKDALTGLEESLPMVQKLLKWKNEGKKIVIPSGMLKGFISQCQGNIESAKSHLSEEEKKEAEAKELRELQRIEALTMQKERDMEKMMKKEKAKREQHEREKKARAKMDKVDVLKVEWEQQARFRQEQAEKRAAQKQRNDVHDDFVIINSHNDNIPLAPQVVEENINTGGVFHEDSDDDSDDGSNGKPKKEPQPSQQRGHKRGNDDDDDDDDDDDQFVSPQAEATTETAKDLFGDSSDDESDEELVPEEDGPSNKKRRVLDDG